MRIRLWIGKGLKGCVRDAGVEVMWDGGELACVCCGFRWWCRGGAGVVGTYAVVGKALRDSWGGRMDIVESDGIRG